MLQQQMKALLDVGNEEHIEYVRKTDEIERLYLKRSESVYDRVMDYWDLYLAQQDDPRDPVDEQWRSKIFVPLPSSNSITKASQLTDILTSADPMYQVRTNRDDKRIMGKTRPVERLLDYSMRLNSPRRLFFKAMTSRGVQGTTFLKLTFQKRSHEVYRFPTDDEFERFKGAITDAVMAGAPPPPDWISEAEEFDQWRRDVNVSAMYGRIPTPPREGPAEVKTYVGPVLSQVPLWSVRVDPSIESMEDQPVVIHRVIRSLDWVEARADNDPKSKKPFRLDAVKACQMGSEGDLVTQYERHLSEVLGVEPPDVSDPRWGNYVELLEVWSPDEKFKFAVIMNRKGVINKNPFELPTLDGRPNIFAIRNLPIEGQFFGLSDYQQPYELFKELNQFRRLRMDGSTLSTLPVFAKQAGITLPQNLRSVRPGGIVTLQNVNAIKPLYDVNMPNEAFREPQEIKEEIADATGITGSMKGRDATVGRVTGTEFQGRSGQVQMRSKIDTGIVEDDLQWLPNSIVGLWKQYGDSPLRINVAGSDPVLDISHEELQEALTQQFIFRGPTQAEDPNMLVQQLGQIIPQFQDILQPNERRAALKLMLESLNVAGVSSILTDEATQQMGAQTQQQGQVAQQQGQAALTQATAANAPAPPATIPAGQAPPVQ